VRREPLEIKELLDHRDQQVTLVPRALLGRKVHKARQVAQERQAQQDLPDSWANPETVDPLVPPASQAQQAIRDRKAL